MMIKEFYFLADFFYFRNKGESGKPNVQVITANSRANPQSQIMKGSTVAIIIMFQKYVPVWAK